MSSHRHIALLLVALGAPACGILPLHSDDAPIATSERIPALLVRSTRVFDGRTNQELDGDPMRAIARAIEDADVVFLGETHLDRATHELERAVLALLADPDLERSGFARRRTVLAMEMFERDAQAALDDYLGGRIDEPTFLARSRPWGNYPSDYRPMIEDAKAFGVPVVASNIPATLRRKLTREGQAAYDALTAEEKAFVPRTLIENPPEYWARVDNVTRAHGALGMPSSGDASRLFDGQNLWDNTMAESCADALDAHPGAVVLHVNGGFHSERWQGTVWQLQQRKPNARIVTIAIETSTNVDAVEFDGDEPIADLRVVVHARARSESDGAAAVTIAREHEFRLHVPRGTTPVPLFVWIGDDGETAQDVIDSWRPILGDEAAILALEPSFPYVGEDGIRGGRWFFAGSAAEGGGLALAALDAAITEAIDAENVAGRNRLDPARIVVGGARSGATMAVFAARYTDSLAAKFLAFAPEARDEFGLMTLPLPLRPRTPERLLIVHDSGEEFWTELTADDEALRLATSVSALADDPVAREWLEIGVVRAALGLAPASPNPAADAILRDAPQHPRALRVARTLARRARGAGLTTPPSLAIDAAAFADGMRLPRSSGAFGGTTIVVLPDDVANDVFAQWKALENPDVINKVSRFNRLRVARGTGDESPKAVIEKLRAENAQRRDFLLVPATFCAGPAEMRVIRERLGPLADELRLEFLPGLGDRLPVGDAKPANHP